jgi:hypothetical protein
MAQPRSVSSFDEAVCRGRFILGRKAVFRLKVLRVGRWSWRRFWVAQPEDKVLREAFCGDSVASAPPLRGSAGL